MLSKRRKAFRTWNLTFSYSITQLWILDFVAKSLTSRWNWNLLTQNCWISGTVFQICWDFYKVINRKFLTVFSCRFYVFSLHLHLNCLFAFTFTIAFPCSSFLITKMSMDKRVGQKEIIGDLEANCLHFEIRVRVCTLVLH